MERASVVAGLRLALRVYRVREPHLDVILSRLDGLAGPGRDRGSPRVGGMVIEVVLDRRLGCRLADLRPEVLTDLARQQPIDQRLAVDEPVDHVVRDAPYAVVDGARRL